MAGWPLHPEFSCNKSPCWRYLVLWLLLLAGNRAVGARRAGICIMWTLQAVLRLGRELLGFSESPDCTERTQVTGA